MFKSFLLTSAMAFAAPALAQTTAAPPPDEAAQPLPTQPAPAAEAAPEPANAGSAVASVIEADWAKYDKDENGTLSKEEFAAWMIALRAQNPAQKDEVKDVASWANAAFAQADSDKNGSVTRPELEIFLKG